MSQELIEVELLFENMDSIRIPVWYFETCRIDGVHTDVPFYADKDVPALTWTDDLDLVLKREIEDGIDLLRRDIMLPSGDQPFWQRLERHDLVSLTLYYTEGDCEKIHVLWKDEEKNEYRNQLMHTEITEHGDYRIAVRKEETEDI